MEQIEALLKQRWILKRNDRDLYYRIKDQVKELRKFFLDKLGYSIQVHQHYIRLDKVPGKAEPWMGITAFNQIEEYQIFCLILVFLEDRSDEEQFVLSDLTEFVALQLNKGENYWVNFKARKMMVNVLRYCIESQLIVQDDGSADAFMSSESTEVLFENTGLSRYFMRHFMTDIFQCETPSDFMQDEWLDDNQDRGNSRSQRIYRRLLLAPGLYKENEEDDDFSYIHNYRNRSERDFNQLFACDLQVYQSSAYLVLEETNKSGDFFPKANALDELVVICLGHFTKMVKSKKWQPDDKENLWLDEKVIYDDLKKTIQKNFAQLPSTYQKKGLEHLVDEILKRILMLGFGKQVGEQFVLYPIIGKVAGQYEGVKG